ncbi:MAG: 2-succinyl-5-enolpyruvyl-6-hydroxy-3-cyclohexene-1-carboxylic-acid synthase [Deltaproteobacteria bacterium]|nr:2-succinyl-5-enolpyruvyl-6-hydroxy-3-cyclohexene-1-carboxylic-acid synthase [Deltaproteobacteria bacterium]
MNDNSKINLHLDHAASFIAGLASRDITSFVISPGARSTLLTLSALRSKVPTHTIIDERSAAFFALGQSRASGKPAVLICTSGTAGAHYLPALMEAKKSHIPLIAVTADRPWEEQERGASQTAFQHRLFGEHVNAYLELGEPFKGSEQYAESIALKSVFTSLYPCKGPVHVNTRIRKPLHPIGSDNFLVQGSPLPATLSNWPPSGFSTPVIKAEKKQIATLIELIQNSENGFIISGPLPHDQDRFKLGNQLSKLSDLLNYTIISDFTGASKPAKFSGNFISNGSALFLSEQIKNIPIPQIIIEINSPLISSGYRQFIYDNPSIPRVIITQSNWIDEHGNAAMIIIGDVSLNIKELILQAKTLKKPKNRSLKTFKKLDSIVKDVHTKLSHTNFTHINAARTLSQCTKGTALITANSMTIRDISVYGDYVESKKVFHQRGLAGIDGLISGAAGTAMYLNAPVILAIGDVSAFHDAGGFALLSLLNTPLAVVILNNYGGRIFEQLPAGKIEQINVEIQESFITTPNISFKELASAYKINYTDVSDRNSMKTEIQNALKNNYATVIEAKILID